MGMPKAPETTDAVLASTTSNWNMSLNARRLTGEGLPHGPPGRAVRGEGDDEALGRGQRQLCIDAEARVAVDEHGDLLGPPALLDVVDEVRDPAMHQRPGGVWAGPRGVQDARRQH